MAFSTRGPTRSCGGYPCGAPPDGYAVSFAHFHERRLMAPPHRLLLLLLHHYKIELQHLNPYGI